MYDLVSIGSLTVDLYFQGESLTSKDGRFELALGGKYFTDHFHEGLGGGAANVAIGARRYGLAVALKTTINDSGFRTMIEQKLQHEHISYLFSHFEKDYQNISCILLTAKGDKTVVNYRTPHLHIFSSEKEKHALLRGKAVFMGNLADVSLSEKVETLRFYKKNDKLTIVNLGVTDCRRSREQTHEILQHTDILIVNVYEFADLIKKPVDKIDFRQNQYDALKAPNVSTLVVTHDKKGSYGYTRDEFVYQAAIKPPKIIDSTGAGDAYTGAFIAATLQNKSLTEAMHDGSEYAAKILSKIGAN